MEVLKKNTKSIAIATGFAALAVAGSYLIYKRYKTGSKTIKTPDSETEYILSEKEKDAILKNLKITYNGQMLSVESVIDMAVALSKFNAAVCTELGNKANKVRRANKDNLIQYAQVCQQSLNSMGFAVERVKMEVHSRLGVSAGLWERSFQYYIQQGHPKILDIEAKMAQAESEVYSQKTRLEISKEEVKKLMAKMIELYKAELVTIPALNSKFRQPVLTSLIIEHRVTDAIYEEFKIEPQDFQGSLQKYLPQFEAEDHRIYQEFQEIEKSAQTAPQQAMQGPQGNRFY